MAVKELGKYIVANSQICHGKPTFRGTRIMVKPVLEMVATGLDWDTIVRHWGGRITKEEIAEAVTLATEALVNQASSAPVEPETELISQ